MNKRQSFLVILLVGLSITLGWLVGNRTTEDSSITVGSGQYASILKDVEAEKALLIDVRTPAEYQLSHVIGAELYGLDRLQNNQNPDFEMDKKLYVYCRSGNRSAEATTILQGLGYEVEDLGGLDEMYDLGSVFERTPLKDYQTATSETPLKLPYVGAVNAEKQMIQYIDFMCPYCNLYGTDIEPRLIEDFAETGLLGIEYRSAAFQSAESVIAASAAYCAHEQAAFWTYSEQLHDGIAEFGGDGTDTDRLIGYAESLDLEMEQFTNCVLDGKYVDLVRSETALAREMGVQGTPLFVLEETAIPGLLSYEDFANLIEAD